ncbi:MAG TPA: hypothetical protein VMG60_19445 [Burkholderiaceae bacterium]|nr:hypothetical protein [Burkholderiaceae bacterium]
MFTSRRTWADNLTVAANATSQIAFPQDVTTAVWASSLYAAFGQNTSVTSFSADSVFADGTACQMATVSGDVASGFAANLTVGIAARRISRRFDRICL